MNHVMPSDLYRNVFAVFVLAGVVALTGCGGVPSRVHSGKVDSVLNQDPADGSYVTAIGIGGSDPSLPSDTQRKALARDAAIVKAQYEMLSMVKGVTLKGGVTVERAIETDSTLEANMEEAIRGAEIVKSEFTSDNGCVVTIRIPRARLEQLLKVQFE
ncbi:MAG TPA: hypothetical protein VH309_08410 [Elusimicrobiota bacterium]|jgi:hypothetical protein|nr:hypothetical protein [Elusimicrobiota bacterium]